MPSTGSCLSVTEVERSPHSDTGVGRTIMHQGSFVTASSQRTFGSPSRNTSNLRAFNVTNGTEDTSQSANHSRLLSVVFSERENLVGVSRFCVSSLCFRGIGEESRALMQPNPI